MTLGMWRYSCDHPTAFNAGRSGRPHYHLGRLSPVRLRPQPIADDTLPARDIALHESAPAVPRRPLPAHAAALGDTSEMRVALCRRGPGRLARHRIYTRRHDHGRSGMRDRNFGINVVAVVGAIASDG